MQPLIELQWSKNKFDHEPGRVSAMSELSPSAAKKRFHWGVLAVSCLACVMICLSMFSTPMKSYASDTQLVDELTAFADDRKGPGIGIPEKDRSILKRLLADGKIRAATAQDKRGWEALAKKGHHEIDVVTQDYGRTFAIVEPIEELPIDSMYITFFVSKGIPFPKEYGNASYYNMNNGGWLSMTQYDDGTGQKIGLYPHKY